MNKKSNKFLFELLSTPSPSGHELEIQKKWLAYVGEFADKTDSDIAGNAFGIINPDAEFKILLAGHCDEIGFVINRIDDNGYLYFAKVGGISHKIAPGLKIEVLGTHKKITGIVGVNAEHQGGLGDKFGYENLYIDCGAKDKKEMEKFIQIGDLAVYKREPEFLLNDRISARGLDNRTGAFLIAEVLKRLSVKRPKVGVYAASTVGEEIGLQGAYFAGAGIKPDMALACDVTFATDHPGVDINKYGEYKLDGGPILAKGAPINKKINDMLIETAKKLDIKLQFELTPASTGTDADRIRYTGTGVPVALVSLPLRYMHSPVETISLKDLEQEIDLITEMICNLTGDENLKPLQ